MFGSIPAISIVFYLSDCLIIHKYYIVLIDVVLESQNEGSVALNVLVKVSRLY